METITSISKVRTQLATLAKGSKKHTSNPVIVVQKSEPVLAIIAYDEYLELKKLKEKEQNDKLDYSEPTGQELLMQASRIFNVNSEPDPDDDLIADPSKIKPLSI